MKKMALFLVVLSSVVVLGGCKKSQKETEPATTEPVTEAVTETEPPTTEAPTEPPREDSMDHTRELKGLVLSSQTDTLTIQTERGKQLKFSTAGADIQLANGLQTGSTVTIMYKGVISGTDTSQAKVLMIVDLAAGETPVTEGDLIEESLEADPEAGAGSINGTIEDLNTDRIVITADDGESYYFSVAGAKMNLINGLQEGNYVTVAYNGDIYGPDLVPATSITDNDPSAGDETVKPGPSASGSYSYVSGTVMDYSTNTVSIYTDDGDALTFDTTGATHYYSYGIVADNYITVEYAGQLDGTNTAGVQVVAVYDYDEDAATAAPDESNAGSTQQGNNDDADDGAEDDTNAVDDEA